jgi:hypothetical protein
MHTCSGKTLDLILSQNAWSFHRVVVGVTIAMMIILPAQILRAISRSYSQRSNNETFSKAW